MPARLRPIAPPAPDAILVGDPGRSLLLAQELLEEPRMSNHARGLWGYSGRTPAGRELTIQATGIGGPSAAAIFTELVRLGLRRAIRVGTCTSLDPAIGPGDVLLVERAIAGGGSAASFGLVAGDEVAPDAELLAGLRRASATRTRLAAVASFDEPASGRHAPPPEAVAADMQTLAVLARGRELGVATAALLIVSEGVGGETLADEPLEAAAKRCGRLAARLL
jgi:purine-nucleoside phosphorylase